MYYAGINPDTMQPIYVAKTKREKMLFFLPFETSAVLARSVILTYPLSAKAAPPLLFCLAFDYALTYISKYTPTEKILKNKLYEKGYGKIEVEYP